MAKITAKDIRTNIARALSYLKRLDHQRTLETLIDALKGYLSYKVTGSEKIEFESKFAEIARALPTFHQLAPILPKGYAYKKGEEIGLLKMAVFLTKKIEAESQQPTEDEDADGTLDYRREKVLLRMRDALFQTDKVKLLATLRKLIDEFGDMPGTYTGIASNYCKHGLFVEAQPYINRALEKDANDGEAILVAAEIFAGLGEQANAETFFKKYFAAFGESARLYMRLSQVYTTLGLPKKALSAARKAVDLDPEDYEAQELMDEAEDALAAAGTQDN